MSWEIDSAIASDRAGMSMSRMTLDLKASVIAAVKAIGSIAEDSPELDATVDACLFGGIFTEGSKFARITRTTTKRTRRVLAHL